MSKCGILINFVFFITILVLSTSAKPTSPDEKTENEEYTKFTNDRQFADKICKEKYVMDIISPGEDVKLTSPNNNFCYQRCMLEKTGHMKNNEIGLDKVLKTVDILTRIGGDYKLLDDDELEILKKCIKKANSKHLEGYCDPPRRVMQCLADETSDAQNV